MKRWAQFALSGVAIVAGAAAGFVLATNDELRSKLLRQVKDVYQVSQEKVEVMTEEVALRTAKLTNNPKINQDWVSGQWDNIGY